ncbi:hypothetical protein HDU76_004340 [Blyttiomyces sp. JEL0837]|nr:hypothetical protein HDU76_004340 [Blyttiomyces sp. JEL0837]
MPPEDALEAGHGLRSSNSSGELTISLHDNGSDDTLAHRMDDSRTVAAGRPVSALEGSEETSNMIEQPSGLFAICMVAFLAMHTALMLANKTTIESMEGARRIRTANRGIRVARNVNIFDLGNYENWIQVMGKDTKYWLIPVRTR